MSKINDLIKELCPNGVEYKKVWEVTIWDKKYNSVDKYMQPNIVKYNYLLANQLNDIVDDNGDVLILETGINSIYKFTNEKLAGKNLCKGEVIAIPWGGTPNVKYYNGKFVTADNRIAISRNVNVLNTKFLYYLFKNRINEISRFYRGAGIKHPEMKKILMMKIPIPPMKIQNEIVKILDKFNELESDLKDILERELKARKVQYEFWREKLFNSDNIMYIEDICKNISSGGTPSTSHNEYYSGDIPWLRTQEINWNIINDTKIKITSDAIKNSSAKLITKNCVIIAMYGATVGKVAINNIPLTTNQACCNLEINPKIANYKYVFYWLSSRYKYIKSLGQGSQTNINAKTVTIA